MCHSLQLNQSKNANYCMEAADYYSNNLKTLILYIGRCPSIAIGSHHDQINKTNLLRKRQQSEAFKK
jgi:hypothetical protein